MTTISGHAVAGMALAALAMVLTPGPNMLYLVSRSLGQGRRAGLVSLAGTAVGFLAYLAAATAGLAVVFAAVPWLYAGLKLAGVAYLGHLAWGTLRPGGRGAFEVGPVSAEPAGVLFRKGLVTNLLNPKVAVMYVTLIPQFVDPARGDAASQSLALGGVQIAVSLVVNAAIVMAAGALAALLATRPRWQARQRRLTGALLGGVALLLARDVAAPARW